MAPVKITDIAITPKHANAAVAVLMCTKQDGSIDWGRFMSMTNYGNIPSAKVQLGKVRRELNAMLEAKGLGPNDGWTDDDAVRTPKKRKATAAAGDTINKKRATPKGPKAAKEDSLDDEGGVESEDMNMNLD